MRVLNVTVAVCQDTPLTSRPFINPSTGGAEASLIVGEYEFVVLGRSAALRRVARELVVAAEQAEMLGREQVGAAP